MAFPIYFSCMNKKRKEKKCKIKICILNIMYILFFCICFILVGIGLLHQSYFNKTLHSSVSLILDDCTINTQYKFVK